MKENFAAVPNLHNQPLELEEVDVDWDDDKKQHQEQTKVEPKKEEKQIIKDEISDNYEDDDWDMSDHELMLEDNTKKPQKAVQ